MRSPICWLDAVAAPTWVLEGDPTQGSSNIQSLREMEKRATNPQLHFVGVPGADHFSILSPVNGLIARKILVDTGQTTNLQISEAEAVESLKK